jgi:GWxTD domain-containing protein
VNLLETWVATPLAGAVGWTLVHSLWESAIISAALAASLAVLGSARARYAAAWLAMIAMLVGIGLTFAYALPDAVQGGDLFTPPVIPAWIVRTGGGAPASSGSGFAAAVPWLAPFWILGAWLFAAGRVAGWMWVYRLRRRGVCCAPECWQRDLARLSGQLRLTRPVQLLESCFAEVPAVVGHLRPVILLPIGLIAGLPAGQIEAVLLHELAHIRRYDYLLNAIQRSIEGLLFFNPAIWWISRVISTERENCCDDMVVETRGDVQEYAAALIFLERYRCSGRAAIAATGGNLVKRIRRLLLPRRASRLVTPLFGALALCAISVVVLAAWGPATFRPTAPVQEPKAASGESSTYQKWLDQEVAYIITDQERAAFRQLATNEERDEFIKQFWERRNPDPGGPENVFREEYYRRIAYANEHFSAARPGWKTDRGHMYIIYGPPDEIDSHPANKPYAFEVWTYGHLKGVGDGIAFTFVDQTANGDFGLASPPWKWPAKKDSTATP